MLQNRLAQLREKRAENDNGFTLIELLVVVVIIGILIAIAIPLYLNYTKGSHDSSADSDLRNAVSTLEQCNNDNGSYPTAVDATGAMTNCTSETIKASSGTSFSYAVNGSDYVIESQNSSGKGTVYCYASKSGGSVGKITATAMFTDGSMPTGDICPA